MNALKIGTVFLLWGMANLVYSQAASPPPDPYPAMTNAQLIGYFKTDPKTTSEYDQFDGALAELRHRRPEPALVSQLMDLLQGGLTKAQNEAVQLLVFFGSREATPLLCQWLGTEPSGESMAYRRGMALAALEQLMDPASKPVLVEYFRGSFGDRGKVMVVLAKMGCKELVPEFKAFLGDRLTYHQAYAAEALAILGDGSGREVLLNLLRNNKYGPSPEELEALVAVGGPGDLGLLDEIGRKFPDQKILFRNLNFTRLKIQVRSLREEEKIKKLSELLSAAQADLPGGWFQWALSELAACGAPALEALKRIALGNGPFYIRDEAYHQLLLKGVWLDHTKTDSFVFVLPAASVGTPAPAGNN